MKSLLQRARRQALKTVRRVSLSGQLMTQSSSPILVRARLLHAELSHVSLLTCCGTVSLTGFKLKWVMAAWQGMPKVYWQELLTKQQILVTSRPSP